MMKKLVLALGVLILGFSGLVQADVIGNKDSKFFFPSDCSYAKLIKKDNIVTFKTAADAVAAGYKASSKCKAADSNTTSFVGNKSSKFFFPSDCSYVKMIKDGNKVTFKSSADAIAAGYKASSKCSDAAAKS
jgi:methylphosphotriester-DNA--protein-cysteine methyltransferase